MGLEKPAQCIPLLNRLKYKSRHAFVPKGALLQRMKFIGIMLLLALYGGEAHGSDDDLKTLRKLLQTSMDNPVAAHDLARASLASHLSPEAELETRYYLLTSTGDAGQSLQDLNAAAQRLQQPALAMLLKMQDAISRHQPPQETEKRALIQDLLVLADEAYAKAWLYVESLILLKTTDLEYELGDVSSGLQHVQRILDHLQGQIPPESYPLIRTRQKLSDFLDPQGESEKAGKVMEETIAILQVKPYRFELANTHRFLGMTIARQGKDYPRAEREYRLALQYARQLGARKLEGKTLTALAGVYGLTGRFVECQPILDQAIAIMKESRVDAISISDAYRIKARNYIRSREWDKVLEAVRMASMEEALVDRNYRILLVDLKAQALVGLGRFQEAYEERMTYTKLLQEIQEAERETDINRLKVDMGLRIEEEQNKKLQMENQVHRAQLDQEALYRRIALGLIFLAGLVMALMLLALRSARAVRRSQQRMKRILDNIEEGILTIGPSLTVESDLSPYLMKILGETRRIQSVAQLLNHFDISQDESQTIQATLQAVIGETLLSWSMNAVQLPSQAYLSKERKHLSMEWQALYEHDTIQSVLLVLRDITDRLHLLEERDRARDEAQKVDLRCQEILRLNHRTADIFVRDLESALPEILRGLEDAADLIPTQRLIHTIKGVGRTLGFKDLSAAAHQLEDGIQRKQTGQLDDIDIKERIRIFNYTAADYLKYVKHFFQKTSITQSSIPSLHEIVSRHLSYVHLSLEAASFQLASVKVQDDYCQWDLELDRLINSILTHALANCVDHGFILPRNRGLNVSHAVRILVEAEESQGILRLSIQDNGSGIDMERLKKLAEQAGFHPGPDQHWTDFLFQDGVSTAASLSERSGRGVGLAAIHELCRRHKGRVEILPNSSGPGTALRIQIPLQRDVREAVA